MSSATAPARIEFLANMIDDEIKKALADEYDMTFEDGQPKCPDMDIEVEIADGLFELFDSARNYGEFEELEILLVAQGIPFDRTTSMDYSIEPRLRVFRPGGVDDSFLLDPESYEPVVPVAQIRALLGRDDPIGAAAIRRWLDEHFPSYPPLTNFVKEA